jgi:hypothetical protein
MTSLIKELNQFSLTIPDPRQGLNKHYTMAEIVLPTFNCFWAQDGSMHQFDARMENFKQRENIKHLYGLNDIPKADQIRNVLDQVDYNYLTGMTYNLLGYVKNNSKFSEFKVLSIYYVIALDGSQIFGSQKIKCNSCLTKQHANGNIEYYHTVLHASIVSPKTDLVIPLVPEFSQKDDTSDKQDCEINCGKRWLNKHFDKTAACLKRKDFIFVNDALYCNDTFVKLIEKLPANYIMNCKEDGNKTLFEFVNGVPNNSFSIYDKVKGFDTPKKHTYSWLNNIPLVNSKDSSRVNFLSVTIEGVKKVKQEIIVETDELQNTTNCVKAKKKINKVKKQYIEVLKDVTFSFVTNFEVNENNIIDLIEIGRSRWKIENNNFNVLKNGGYDLEHNYGHDDKFLSNTLAYLNILAFSFHKAHEILNKYWITGCSLFKSKVQFLQELRRITSYHIFSSFNALFRTISADRAPPWEDKIKSQEAKIRAQGLIIKNQEKIIKSFATHYNVTNVK